MVEMRSSGCANGVDGGGRGSALEDDLGECEGRVSLYDGNFYSSCGSPADRESCLPYGGDVAKRAHRKLPRLKT